MISPKRIARIAGILYVVVFLAAVFGPIYVQSALVVPGDAAETANRITSSLPLYRAGIGSYLAIFMTEIALTILLYVLMRPVNKTLSLIAAAFRLAMTIIHGLNLLNQFAALLLLSGNYLAAFEIPQIQALAMLFLEAHGLGWSIGMVFFSFHAFFLGYLVYRSGFIPKLLGVLLLLASASYLIDATALLLSPGYTETPIYFAVLITLAELAFPLWLLIKGVNAQKWDALAHATGA
jgi:hypothetical protein